MVEFPFQLIVKHTSLNKGKESLLCTDLLRIVPGKRAIYDAIWKEKSVIVKVFSHKIKARFHLKRELNGLNELQKRGFNSAKSLFSGKKDDGRWIIVLEKIVDSSTVLEVLAETADKHTEQKLLLRVSRELAKQHRKGILQKDLHLGNFLLAEDLLYSIDPSQMVFLPVQISRKKSISQLALLVLNLQGSDVQPIKSVCEEYFKARGWNYESSDEALLLQQLNLHRKDGIRRGLKKCLRTCKRFLRIKDDGIVAVFDRDFCLGSEPLDLARQIDTLMDKGQILKDGNTCYVSRLNWNGKDIVIKRYNNKGFLHSLRHTIKRSRAKLGWLHGHRLEMLNVATPKPLAYIEQSKGLLVEKSYLINKFVEGQKLYDFVHDEKVTQQQQETATQQVKDLLDIMAEHRITHGDLKNSNVLITQSGPVLIDLDGMKVHKWDWFCKVQKAKDLKRLAKDK